LDRGPLETAPATLDGALDDRDPAALADTSLPRLRRSALTDRERLAARLASWDVGARVAAYAFLQVGTTLQARTAREEAPPIPTPLIELETTDCAVHQPGLGGARARA